MIHVHIDVIVGSYDMDYKVTKSEGIGEFQSTDKSQNYKWKDDSGMIESIAQHYRNEGIGKNMTRAVTEVKVFMATQNTSFSKKELKNIQNLKNKIRNSSANWLGISPTFIMETHSGASWKIRIEVNVEEREITGKYKALYEMAE